jgi:flagella basal body P-ring formation protein FlgA
MKTLLLIITAAAILTLPPGVLAQCSADRAATDSGASACHQVGAQDIEAAIRSSSTELPEGLQIEVLDYSRGPALNGPLSFALNSTIPAAPDGSSVLHGHIDAGAGRLQPVWARVRLTSLRSALVARQDIEAGSVLTDDQWERRQMWLAYPESHGSSTGLGKDRPTGARLKRGVRSGEVINPAWLDVPPDIRRGQIVDLHVQAGAAHLRLQGVALNNARRGESVEIRVADRGPGLTAIVSGPGSALVETRDPNANLNLAGR